MAQVFNPASTLNEQQAVNLQAVNVTADVANNPVVDPNEFIPYRTLKNSVASTAFNGQPDADFSAYAASIPDNFATNESPKLKFLFTVSFQPRGQFTLPETGSDSMDGMKFALKRATRPVPTITYMDVNYYGFRTKVATKMDYGTVTLTFYDDVVNRAHNIVSQYINYMSPISLKTSNDADNLDEFQITNSSRSIGAMDSASKLGPFRAMAVTHFMLDDKAPGGETILAKTVTYEFLNPKILSVNLDELDMTQSEANNVEVTFVYDSVSITYSDAPASNPTTTQASTQGGTSSNPIITNNAISQPDLPGTNTTNSTPVSSYTSFDDSIQGFSRFGG